MGWRWANKTYMDNLASILFSHVENSKSSSLGHENASRFSKYSAAKVNSWERLVFLMWDVVRNDWATPLVVIPASTSNSIQLEPFHSCPITTIDCFSRWRSPNITCNFFISEFRRKHLSIEVVLPEHRVGGHTLQLALRCVVVSKYPKLSLDSDLLVTSLIGSLKRGWRAALHLTKLDLWWLTAWYALQLLKASVPICWSAWLNH